MPLDAVSLFSGCGGSDLGLRKAGVGVIWANEKNEAACRSYEDVAGKGVVQHADVAEIDFFPKADLLVGCYPCQGYSQGGNRTAAAKINFLYRHFDRALRSTRPLAFIVENVDGMRFRQNSSLLRNQLTRFRLAGYRVAWKVLDAKDFGLAQSRRRLFMVGIRTSECKRYTFPSPTHGPDKGRAYRTQRDVIYQYRSAESGSFCHEPLHWYYLSRNRRRSWDEYAACVVANWRHVGLHPDSPPLRKVGTDEWVIDGEGTPRRLSYLDCAALQGFPEPEAFTSGSTKLKMRAIGNAVPPPLFHAVAARLIDVLGKSE